MRHMSGHEQPGLNDRLTRYYEQMLEEREGTERVDWHDRAAQHRSFAAVSEVFRGRRGHIDVYEVGCGLGDMDDYLAANVQDYSYSGCDISGAMIAEANRLRPHLALEIRDILQDPAPSHDFVVGSGLFTDRSVSDDAEFGGFVRAMLRRMFEMSRHGLAVTFLTANVDFRTPGNYYQSAPEIFAFAQTELSRFVEIRHAYFPWEFTLLVYKKPQGYGADPA
jgi:SAM-dependent methyltransferase